MPPVVVVIKVLVIAQAVMSTIVLVVALSACALMSLAQICLWLWRFAL